jgi:hypothetical protein
MKVMIKLLLPAFVILFNACSAQRTNDILSKNNSTMKTDDFTTTILVDKTPKEAFDAVNNVRGWWSEEIDGNTDALNEVFRYHFKDLHKSTMRITEMLPGKRVVWLVEDNYFQFTKDKKEWIGTEIIFDISTNGDKTQLTFTHKGLVPDYECYHVCHDAWTGFIQNSLYNLITTGKGQPNPKDGVNDINSSNLKKHGLEK